MEEVIPQGIPCWTASNSRLGEPPPPSPPPPPPCGPPPLDLRLRAPPPPQPPGRPLPIGERSGGWGRSSSSGGGGSTAGGEAWSMVWVRLRGGLGGGITFREAWPGLLHPLGGARGRPRLKPRCRLLKSVQLFRNVQNSFLYLVKPGFKGLCPNWYVFLLASYIHW